MRIEELEAQEIQHGNDESYFIINGEHYNLSDFMRCDHIPGYHAFLGLTQSGGMAIKISECGESVTPAYVN